MTKAKKNSVRAEYIYLNRLRESGVTNMFGAAPYLTKHFGFDKRLASKVLVDWMRWVEEDASRREL